MLSLNDWGRVLVSIIVVAGFLVIIVLVLTTKLQGTATSEVLLVLLGALAAAFGQVVSFWVGSSSSSATKDATIQDMAKKS
ncbi:MAG: hypothetical protein QOF48_3287 [Verrucomicrobiota bacterium]|jgi:hypothetical protein